MMVMVGKWFGVAYGWLVEVFASEGMGLEFVSAADDEAEAVVLAGGDQ